MNLLVLLSGGWEAGFIGLMTGLISLIFLWLHNKSRPIRNKIVTNMKLQINPNDVKSLVEKGYEEIREENFSSAINFFQKVKGLSSNNCDALAGLAIAYHLSKDYPNSKTAIETYFKNVGNYLDDPSNAALMTYFNGHHFYLNKNFDQAQNCKNNALVIAKLSEDMTETILGLNLY